MRFTKVILWPVCVLILHTLLTVIGGYYWWAHVDKIMHTLGGMAIALMGLDIIALFERQGLVQLRSKLFTAAIVIAFVCLAAVCWEFLEFILDHTVHTYLQPSLADTMGDLLAGLMGSTTIAALKVLPARTDDPKENV